MNAVSTTPTDEKVIDTSMLRRERPVHALALPADVTPPQLLAVAVQRGADLEYVSKLMDLAERWEKNQARKAFEIAISAAKAEIKPILKNREVDFTTQKGRTNYKYEDFAQIALEVDPILAKYGLSYRHRPLQNGKTLTVTCIVSHRDGHQEESSLSADNDESGNKNSIQGVGSTATYLQRYTLKLALGLAASKDDDGRGIAPKNEAPEPPQGYDAWSADLGAVVDEGRERLLKVWKDSPMEMRAYMVKHEAHRWNSMKKASGEVSA